jgi:hypothetical protein
MEEIHNMPAPEHRDSILDDGTFLPVLPMRDAMLATIVGLDHYQLRYEPPDPEIPIVKMLPPLPRLQHYTLRCKSCGHAVHPEDPDEPHIRRLTETGQAILRDGCPL